MKKSGDINEKVIVCDVDDTLVMWDNHTQPGDGKI